MGKFSIKNYDVRALLDDIKIKEIMTSPVPTVKDHETLSKVEEIFITHRTSHVCVVNNEGELVGNISQKYLYKIRSPKKIMPGEVVDMDDGDMIIDGDSFYDRETLDGYVLADVMDKLITTLSPDDSVGKAVRFMSTMNVGCIAIVGDGRKVKGVLKESNIIKFVADAIDS